jgi:hypothetical protein
MKYLRAYSKLDSFSMKYCFKVKVSCLELSFLCKIPLREFSACVWVSGGKKTGLSLSKNRYVRSTLKG